MSCTFTVAQSRLPCSAKKMVGSRMTDRRCSIVRSARGRVPARRALSLALRHAPAKAAYGGAERTGNGVDPALPAAGRELSGLAGWQR